MRILDKEGLKLGLPELGFLTDDQQTFERIIALPDGILLVTGPTGSGPPVGLVPPPRPDAATCAGIRDHDGSA